MKYLSLLVLIFLTGCSVAVPVTQKFPKAPDTLMQKCTELKPATKDSSLIDLTKVIVDNYTIYYQCSSLVEGWHEWYKTQQNIYKELK